MHRGLVFNVQRYAVQDGPGIRTTVFLKGCPLRCAWCHNPEGISPRQELLILENRCLGCGECRRACPHGSEFPGDGALPPRLEVCEFCGACVAACPTHARQMAGREMSVEEVLEAALRDQVFYQESGGGVTFSGGEPLMQPEFLREVLAACQGRGLHTAVDTCGMAQTEHLLAVAPLTDLFLYDVKFIDAEKHERFTGVSNTLILQNLEALGRVHNRIWVRIPLIPGANDDPAELEGIARFAARIPAVRQVNLLPFHRSGLPKFGRVGRTSAVANAQPPSAPALAGARAIFEAHGLLAKTGG